MLMFLKLGGSLITNKNKPHTLRADILDQAIQEVKSALAANPGLQLILAHGSGSFGHTPAHAYDTIHGVFSSSQWKGFSEVWKEARDLNQYVLDSLFKHSVQSLCFPASSQIITDNRKITHWNITAIEVALKNHFVPLVYGDVVFDSKINGTILSTEDLFSHLAVRLTPERILLAGIEDGVFSDFPLNKHLLDNISLEVYKKGQIRLSKSVSTDVTGGMQTKVSTMMNLIDQKYVQSVSILNGQKKGNILSALSGQFPGTTLSINKRLE